MQVLQLLVAILQHLILKHQTIACSSLDWRQLQALRSIWPYSHTNALLNLYVMFLQDIRPTLIHSLSTGMGNDIVHEPPILHRLRPADNDHFDTVQDISCIQHNARSLPLNGDAHWLVVYTILKIL